ncbi:MAG: hypothetical protein GY936_03410, partial [Ignavibacteriae bacterium]|nr:hypothetical protein [Ignavibacteriota bacterium]
MSKQNKFYDENEYPDKELSEIMWNEIKHNITPIKKEFNFFIEKKSFAFGFAAAVLLILTSINLYTYLTSFAIRSESEILKINRVYSQTINGMEKLLPAALFSEKQIVNVDERLQADLENFSNVNQAINELKLEFVPEDISLIKQKRLRSL